MYSKNLFVVLFGLFISHAALADTMLDINVDTSSLAGQSGWLDFQFNPGDVDAPLATATISSVSTDATLSGLPTLTGDVSGDVNNEIVLVNDQYFNDYLQGVSFGSTLNFDVDLKMPTPSADKAVSGTAFSLSFYDTSFNSLLADPTWGASLVANLNADGSTSILAQTQQVSISTVTPSAVPLPGSFGLLFSGIFMLAGMKRLAH